MIVAVLLAVVLTAGSTQAAPTVLVCYTITDSDTAHVNLYIGPQLGAQWIDVGAVTSTALARTCATVPLPTAATRGQAAPWTLKGVNTLGEEGAASNAITFRTPNLPAVPAALSVGVPIVANAVAVPITGGHQ